MLFRVFVATEWAPAFRDRYKPSARKGVDGALRSQLLPAFGADPLHRISPQDVHRWFDRYSATAPGGANWTLRLLRTILRHAVRRALLQSDPTRTVRPNPRPRHTRFLSRDEIRSLHRHLDASVAERPSRAPQAAIIRLLLFTGCRRSELVNLRWDEVHGDTLQLRRLRVGGYRVVHEVRDDELIVLLVRVAHRRDAYRRTPSQTPVEDRPVAWNTTDRLNGLWASACTTSRPTAMSATRLDAP